MLKNGIWMVFALSFLYSCSSDNGDAGDNPISQNPGNNDTPSIGTGEVTLSFTACEGGMAGTFPCQGFDLLFHMNLSSFNAQSGNDIWGWTDASTGQEYALVGLDNGTAFVDITDAENPIYVGKLETATSSSPWRDVKVYGDYAFIVAEASGHGMQVFDLKKLRDENEYFILP